MVCKQLPRVGLELAALGLWEKCLDLSLFLGNPGVVEALHSSRYTAPPKSSRLEDFCEEGSKIWRASWESRGVAGSGHAQRRRDLLQPGPGVICTSLRGHQCRGSFSANNCCRRGLNSRPSNYEKSVLTSRLERCLFLINLGVIEALHSGCYSIIISSETR